MNIEERERLFMLNDGSDRAVALRLRAARIAAGYEQQIEFSGAAGINYQTYSSQERSGKVPIKTVRFLHRNHRIDYNFIYNGDFLQLSGDVQDALAKALAAATHGEGQTPNWH